MVSLSLADKAQAAFLDAGGASNVSLADLAFAAGVGAGGTGAQRWVPKTVTVAADTAVVNNFLTLDATANNVVETLPADASAGDQVAAIRTDSSVHTVTIVAAGKTIQGDANATLASGTGATFVYDGANWVIGSTMILNGSPGPAELGMFPVGSYADIYAAMAAASAAGGGEVILKYGNNGPVSVKASIPQNVKVKGFAFEWSVWGYNEADPSIYYPSHISADGTAEPVFEFAAGVVNASIEGVMIKANGRIGVNVADDAVTRGGNRIRNVYVNGGSTGFYIGQLETRMEKLLAMACTSHGISVQASDCELTEGLFGFNGGHGILLGTTSGPIRMTTVDTFNNTLTGLTINGFNHIISAIQSNGNKQQGVVFSNTTQTFILGAEVIKNGREYDGGVHVTRYANVEFKHPTASNTGCGIIGGLIQSDGVEQYHARANEVTPSLPMLIGVSLLGANATGADPASMVFPITNIQRRGCPGISDLIAPGGGLTGLQLRSLTTEPAFTTLDNNGVIVAGARADGAFFGLQFDPLGWGFPMTVLPGSSYQNNSVAANSACWYMRVYNGGTSTKVGYFVGASSGNISVAALRNSGVGRAAVPSTRVGTTGAVACPAIGYNETALGGSTTLYAGDWFGLSCDNTTATFRVSLNSGTGTDDMYKGMGYSQTTAHPVPNPPSSLTATSARTFVVAGVA